MGFENFATFDYVEFFLFLITLTFLGIFFTLANREKPWMSLFATFIMAVTSLSHYFSQTWGTSHESMKEPWSDELTTTMTIFALAYMFADLPVLLFYSQMETYERIMYTLHHLTSAATLFSSIYFNRYQRLVLFFITAESTNILLNLRKIIPDGTPLKLINDILFSLCFLGYRMCYLFPILVRTLFIIAMEQNWFDLFVICNGLIFVGILHIWWTVLIVQGILAFVVPKKQKVD